VASCLFYARLDLCFSLSVKKMERDGDRKDGGAGDVGCRAGNHQQEAANNRQRAFCDVHVRYQIAAQSCGNGGHAQNGRDGNDGDAAKCCIDEQHVGAEGEYEGNDKRGNGQPCGGDGRLHRIALAIAEPA